MKRSAETPQPNRPHRAEVDSETARAAAAAEREIDQILADSFPASDAPPWTLGVAPAAVEDSRPTTKDPAKR